ncbi:MAG: DNA/RNA non-specific endonuclease, partial [Prevotella sp.]|nr:DNA/RNA non-specific endonuclease [Prevotella sp.]
MTRYRILFGALAAMLLLTSCRKESGTEAERQVNSFVSTTTEGSPKPQRTKVAKPMEQPASIKGVSEQILKRKGYIVSYNKQTKLPNWVAWHLTAAHTEGRVQRENYAFREDEEVKAPRATTDDYYNSRYDRGHMCPAGDNKWDSDAMEETFLLTNVCPQNHGLNKDAWNDLEIACRRWAKK